MTRQSLTGALLLTLATGLALLSAKAIRVLAFIGPSGERSLEWWSGYLPDLTGRELFSLALVLLVALALWWILRPGTPLWMPVLVGWALWSAFAWLVGSLPGRLQWLDAATEQATALALLFRHDVLFLFVLTACHWLVLVLAGTRRRRQGVALLVIVDAALVLATGLELAHFLKTGYPLSRDLLAFGLGDTVGLGLLIAPELDGEVLMALLAPILVFALAWVAIRRLVADRARTPSWRGRAPLALLLILFCAPLTFPSRGAHDRLQQFMPSVQAALVEDLLFAGLPRLGGGGQGVDAGVQPLPTTYGLRTAPRGPEPGPNIVLVLMESVRLSATGLAPSPLPTTPFLDRLAAQGLVVEEMYSPTPRTSAAWLGALSGVRSATGAVLRQWMEREAARETKLPSLAGILGRAGYATAFFTPTSLRRFPYERKLIDFMGYRKVFTSRNVERRAFERINYLGFQDEAMLEPAVEWAARVAADGEPFFMTLMTNAAHHPYRVPSQWSRHELAAPAGAATERSDAGRAVAPSLDEYLNCVAYLDDFLRRFFDALDARGLMDETVVLAVGDHGQSLGEHGRRFHVTSLYEEVVRVPALLHAPHLGLGPGRIEGPRELIDILPTLLGMARLAVVEGRTPGRSLLEKVAADRPVYLNSVFDRTQIGMRRGELKYLHNFDRQPDELYDLSRDPLERRNIAGEIEPEALERWRSEVLHWRSRAAAAFLLDPAERSSRQQATPR